MGLSLSKFISAVAGTDIVGDLERVVKGAVANVFGGVVGLSGAANTVGTVTGGKNITPTVTGQPVVSPTPAGFNASGARHRKDLNNQFGGLKAEATATNIKFNLPPHKWSLPINQDTLSSNNKSMSQKTNENIRMSRTDHGLRRAIMWCYGDMATVNAYSTSMVNEDGKITTSTSTLDYRWGFQFLWNPDKISNALSRNVNFTPSVVDKTSQFYGLFTAMEAVTFNITIDRVNDFAAIKSLNLTGQADFNSRSIDWASICNTYYAGNGYPSVAAQDTVQQVKDLVRLGTMADIEYIYKMINGNSAPTDDITRRNSLGRKTADIGFLSPTVIAVQFGPSAENNLSYVGYIDSLNVTHTMFTEDMIPIHSEVSVNFVAYARTSIS